MLLAQFPARNESQTSLTRSWATVVVRFWLVSVDLKNTGETLVAFMLVMVEVALMSR